ncbi:hypothetical protein LCGC14_2244960, partial [marine sediment metagenome]
MCKKLILVVCVALMVACVGLSQGAVIAGYNFGTDLAATSEDANVTANDIVLASGLTGFGARSSTGGGCLYARCSGTGITNLAGAITDVDYVSFTIDVASGYEMDLTSMTLEAGYTNNTTDTSKSLTPYLLTSVDGFTSSDSLSDITSYANTPQSGFTIYYLSWTIDTEFSGAEFQGLTGSTEFRFYLTDDTDNTNIIHRFDDIVLNGTVSVISGPDTTAPTPNPATFSSAPSADSDTAISMTATTGSDQTGPVEYYFDETTSGNGATDSGWQTSASYTDSGLDADTQYTYTVQMRDS